MKKLVLKCSRDKIKLFTFFFSIFIFIFTGCGGGFQKDSENAEEFKNPIFYSDDFIPDSTEN